MKRIAITLSIILTLIAAVAIAQQPPRGPHDGPGGPAAGAPQCDIASFLGLTADQKTQFDALHEALHATVQPLFDQKKAAEDQLHTLVDATTPDATAIGNQVLAIKAIDQQIKAAHESMEQKVEALLTADQKVKFEAFTAARQCMGGGPRPPQH